jgi:hypothetical protein
MEQWGYSMRGDARLITAWQLSSARRKHRFVYCCVIVGMYFDVSMTQQFFHGANTPQAYNMALYNRRQNSSKNKYIVSIGLQVGPEKVSTEYGSSLLFCHIS